MTVERVGENQNSFDRLKSRPFSRSLRPPVRPSVRLLILRAYDFQRAIRIDHRRRRRRTRRRRRRRRRRSSSHPKKFVPRQTLGGSERRRRQRRSLQIMMVLDRGNPDNSDSNHRSGKYIRAKADRQATSRESSLYCENHSAQKKSELTRN